MEDFNPEVELLYVPATGSKMLENVIKEAAENMKPIAILFVFQFGVLITSILQFNAPFCFCNK